MTVKEMSKDDFISVVCDQCRSATRMPKSGAKIYGLFNGPHTMLAAVFLNYEWNINGVDEYSMSAPVIPGYITNEGLITLVREAISCVGGAVKLRACIPCDEMPRWIEDSGFEVVGFDKGSGETLFVYRTE